jgi:hypothetical protein
MAAHQQVDLDGIQERKITGKSRPWFCGSSRMGWAGFGENRVGAPHGRDEHSRHEFTGWWTATSIPEALEKPLT